MSALVPQRERHKLNLTRNLQVNVRKVRTRKDEWERMKMGREFMSEAKKLELQGSATDGFAFWFILTSPPFLASALLLYLNNDNSNNNRVLIRALPRSLSAQRSVCLSGLFSSFSACCVCMSLQHTHKQAFLLQQGRAMASLAPPAVLRWHCKGAWLFHELSVGLNSNKETPSVYYELSSALWGLAH